jgi:hypothetical protein
MKTAKFILRNQVQRGDVVKENTHTVWVRTKKNDVVKRHRKKHQVEISEDE